MATVLSTELVLSAYAQGAFPMADRSGRITWHSPDPRGIIPLDAWRIPGGSREIFRDSGWSLRVNTVFEEVIRGCADRNETWISDEIRGLFCDLHRLEFAHSIEVWRDGNLAGGLYGVSLGRAFFGESMFSRIQGASKVALVATCALLRENQFHLFDVQWTTPHLAMFGAVEISRPEYLRRLSLAVCQTAKFPKPGRNLPLPSPSMNPTIHKL